MEIGISFKDLKMYNKQMTRTLDDKLFFTEYLPKDDYIFIDFGCADGALIKELKKVYPTSKFIGYDCSSMMICEAKSNVCEDVNTNFTADWGYIDTLLNDVYSKRTKRVLILSSVIHEIYSYAKSEEDINFFWEIFSSDRFDYICVRDMMFDQSMVRPSNLDDIIKLKNNPNIAKQVDDFESISGAIVNNINLIHFLLKYRYVVNWDREVHENYFPISVEVFLSSFKKENIIYLERFRVPFLDECIEEDFDIKLTDYTHIKLIVKGLRK